MRRPAVLDGDRARFNYDRSVHLRPSRRFVQSHWQPFYFERLRLRFDLPAFDMAIATACFCGFPAFISVLMLSEIAFLEDPDFNGISVSRA